MGKGLLFTVFLLLILPPPVTLTVVDSVCLNEPEFVLTGGYPHGGDYMVDRNRQCHHREVTRIESFGMLKYFLQFCCLLFSSSNAP